MYCLIDQIQATYAKYFLASAIPLLIITFSPNWQLIYWQQNQYRLHPGSKRYRHLAKQFVMQQVNAHYAQRK